MRKKGTRPNMPFAKNLNALLLEKQIGVREAARLAGVGVSTLMSWKSGGVPENFLAVKQLANALGTSMSYLLTGEDETRSNMPPSISEVFADGELLFDGFAKITIQRMIHKTKGEKNEN